MLAEFIALIVLFVAVYVVSTVWQNRHLPPGPFPLPVLGNLLSISQKTPYRDLANMAKRYGKLFRVQMGSKKVIVIDSYEIAREALVTKAKDFAGRPPHFFGSIFGRDNTDLAFQTYSRRWKIQHKIAVAAMRLTEDKANVPWHIEELCEAFRSFNGKPFNPRDPVYTSVAGCLSSMLFGEEFKCNDRELGSLIQAIHVFNLSLGAANFIDTFPIFKHVPIPIIQKARRAEEVRDEIFERKFQEHIFAFQNNNFSSLIDAMLKDFRENCSDELSEKYLISR